MRHFEFLLVIGHVDLAEGILLVYPESLLFHASDQENCKLLVGPRGLEVSSYPLVLPVMKMLVNLEHMKIRESIASIEMGVTKHHLL